jgi:hypothetical protein
VGSELLFVNRYTRPESLSRDMCHSKSGTCGEGGRTIGNPK